MQFMTALLLASQSRIMTDRPMFRGHSIGSTNPIYTPRRGKLKGWMRENRRSTFNKNR